MGWLEGRRRAPSDSVDAPVVSERSTWSSLIYALRITESIDAAHQV